MLVVLGNESEADKFLSIIGKKHIHGRKAGVITANQK